MTGNLIGLIGLAMRFLIYHKFGFFFMLIGNFLFGMSVTIPLITINRISQLWFPIRDRQISTTI